ncbi:MAG: hypothetical protein WCY89_01270 [Flavobacteriaceae bacterium]
MNTLLKIFILAIVGFILLGISIVIGEQNDTNLTWVVAFILIILWNVLPKKKNN